MQNFRLSEHQFAMPSFSTALGARVAEEQRQRSLPAPQHATGCAVLREGHGGAWVYHGVLGKGWEVVLIYSKKLVIYRIVSRLKCDLIDFTNPNWEDCICKFRFFVELWGHLNDAM